MTTRAKAFSQFAKFVEPETGTLSAEAGGGLDSADVTNLIDSDYVDNRVSTTGGEALGSLTKSFVRGETATVNLSGAASPAPVVSVVKETQQIGVSSKNKWDIASDGFNYDLHDTAYAVTLTPSSASSDGTFTLGAGAFASTDVGKRIVGNGGEAVITATDGSYALVTPFNDTSAIASGDWSMFALTFDGASGVKMNGVVVGFADISTASYDDVSFDIGGQEIYASGLAFNNDGTRMYLIGRGSDRVFQYTLSTAFDISTASYNNVFFDVEDTSPRGITFNNDGTKMYITGDQSNYIRQYTLSIEFDVSTASYNNQYLATTSEDTNPSGLAFNNDGTKMFLSGASTENIFEYDLETAFDITTASHTSGNKYYVNFDDDLPEGLAFNNDGTKMFMVGDRNDRVYQYTLQTAFDITTAVDNGVRFSVGSQDSKPRDIVFNNDGTKMYITGEQSNRIYQYTTGITACPINAYHPAVTNLGGQIDTAFWTDINSMTADETLNGGEVYYAVSTDNRAMWAVIDDTNGVRPIARNNSGTWEYNDANTYAGTTWTSATTNEELYALQEALFQQSQNRMNSTQLESVTDPNHYTLGGTLDLAVILYTNDGKAIPVSDAITINYDAAALNKGAILGTDYDFDFPDDTTIRITSNAAQNLKIKVV